MPVIIDHLNAPRLGNNEEIRHKLYANVVGIYEPIVISETIDYGSQKIAYARESGTPTTNEKEVIGCPAGGDR